MDDGQRPFDPPRPIHVEHDGRWWPGACLRWIRQPDGTWRALCQWTEAPGMQYQQTLPADRVRPAGE